MPAAGSIKKATGLATGGPKIKFALNPYFVNVILTHIPAMSIMVAGGFARGNAMAAGGQNSRKDNDCGQDTSHCFFIMGYGLLPNVGKSIKLHSKIKLRAQRK